MYSWRSTRKPRIGPLSHDGCCKLRPRSPVHRLAIRREYYGCSRWPQGRARCRIEPLSAFRIAGPHLGCGHIMAGAGSSALASVKPGLSKPAPRAGPAAYVRDPRATVTDHGCSRGPPESPAWPLHIFMDATGSGGNLVDECMEEVEASTRCQVRASPPTHPARWSRWDRAPLLRRGSA